MSRFIFYRHTVLGDHIDAYRSIMRLQADKIVPWWTVAEYAANGGYFKAAQIEAGSLEEAWDRAHTDHMPTGRYVKTLDARCPGHSSVTDIFEDCTTGALWMCLDTGRAEMPDDTAEHFRAHIKPPVLKDQPLTDFMVSLEELR